MVMGGRSGDGRGKRREGEGVGGKGRGGEGEWRRWKGHRIMRGVRERERRGEGVYVFSW